jgi:hypothetical protein
VASGYRAAELARGGDAAAPLALHREFCDRWG